MKFNYRFNNLELRSCDELLTDENKHITAEIVKWFNNSFTCYTIAYFIKVSEGFDLKFVGDRPCDQNINWEEFKELIKMGYKKLEINDGFSKI